MIRVVWVDVDGGPTTLDEGRAWARRGRGLAPVPPDPTLSHAADLLRMVTGEFAAGRDASWSPSPTTG